MKRNLSSKAIKAMAIGMAVTLGSTTAISGVITGTVVNIYAVDFNTVQFTAKAIKSSNDLKITITKEGSNVFKADDATKKLTGLVVKNGSKIVFSTDDSGQIANITSDANTNADELVITIPFADITDGSLDGSETSLTITKLTSMDISYGQPSSEVALNFDSGSLNVMTDSAIGIDKTAPTLENATTSYSSSAGTHTVEIALKENLVNRAEQIDSSKFTIVRKGQGSENVQVSKYKFENDKLILTLDKELTDDTYTITYSQEDAELKDAAGNKLKLNSTVDVTVSNIPEDVTAPTITGNIEYNKEAKIVTLTASEDLAEYDESTSTNHKFTVKKDNTYEQTITNVKVDSSEPTKIVITLDKELAEGNYTVGYQGEGITDKAKVPNKLAKSDSLGSFEVKSLPVQVEFTATTSVGTYKFDKLTENTVALKEFKKSNSRQNSNNTFENGVLTAGGSTYTLTQIGTDAGVVLTTLTDGALKGHTNNVTTIKENAFKDNTNVTNLSFPKVTSVGANAFNGATALTIIDLGSEATKEVTIESNAFTGASNITSVITNPVSTTNINDALANSGSSAVIKTNPNDSNATITAEKYYQTKEGLRFKGLSNDSLEFIGREAYTGTGQGEFDGSEEKPYLVTYENGLVTLEKAITSVDVTKDGNILKFEIENNEATLVDVQSAITRANSTTTLVNGVVTAANGQTFNFVKIGNGADALPTDFNATNVLGDENLTKVTTISANAFKSNTATTELTLPAVTNIGANAFNGATGLTKVDLGSSEVNVESGAFTGAANVKVNSENQATIDNVIASGLDQGKIEATASFVTSVVVEDAKNTEIVLTLNKELSTALSEAGDFSVKVTKDGSDVVGYTISSVAGGDSSSQKKVTVTLNKAIENGQIVELTYTGSDILAFTDKEVENKVAPIAPLTVTEAKIDTSANNKITIIVDGTVTLKDVSSVATTGFKVTKANTNANDGTVTLSATGLNVTSGDTIELTLNSGNFSATDSNIKVSYDGSGVLKAANESKVKIESVLVNNKIDTTAPTLDQGTHSDTTITLTKSSNAEYLMPMTVEGDGGFAIKKDSVDENLDDPITVTNVTIAEDSKDIVLTLDKTIPNGTTVKVVYNKTSAGKSTVKDTNGNELADIAHGSGISVVSTTLSSRISPIVASRSTVISERATSLESNTNQDQEQGNVTTINITKDATQEDIQKMITSKLTDIESIKLTNNMTLDFTNVNIVNLNINKDSITGTGTLNITGLNSTDKLALAKKLEGSSNVTINNDTIKDIINDSNSSSGNGGSSSGGGSSSSNGNKFTGSGANIGNTSNNITENNSSNSNNNNNNTSEVVESKDLTLDVINLPSVTGEAKVFSDVSANHWAKSYIDKLSTAGVINGSNGMFNPNGQTKRADATIMLVNLLGLQPEANNGFTDVNSTAYYAPYVGTASTYGIVNGSNGMFNPEGIISRQDTMVMISQILKSLDLNVNTDTSVLNQFSDVNSISSYATESVSILVNSGIISGNNGKLNPTSPVTRAEMATIMSKLYDVLESATK